MKKLILFLTGLMMTVIATSQTTIYNDLILQKTTPRFYLNGTGALIDFNGDIIFTQSANLLTLSGGNLSIGANNFYITGSLGQTGTRILKGWFADLEVTNTPTINGISVATIFAPINNPTFIGTVVLPVTTSIGTVSSTEIDYLDNVTSSIQTQFGVKANINNPSFTGIVTLPATTSVGNVSATEIGYLDGTTSNIQTQFNDTTTLDLQINARSASYTLALTDNYKLVTMSSASAINLTVPPNSSVAFPVGANITIVGINTGQVSIVAGSGVTIYSADSKLKLRVRYSSATLIKLATDTWLLIGDISI